MYRIRWRRTDSNQWEHSETMSGDSVPDVGVRALPPTVCSNDPDQHLGPLRVDCRATLKGIRVDDWVFGVSSVSKDGYESPIASAVPGGAFRPYVAPAEEKK